MFPQVPGGDFNEAARSELEPFPNESILYSHRFLVEERKEGRREGKDGAN